MYTLLHVSLCNFIVSKYLRTMSARNDSELTHNRQNVYKYNICAIIIVVYSARVREMKIVL